MSLVTSPKGKDLDDGRAGTVEAGAFRNDEGFERER